MARRLPQQHFASGVDQDPAVSSFHKPAPGNPGTTNRQRTEVASAGRRLPSIKMAFFAFRPRIGPNLAATPVPRPRQLCYNKVTTEAHDVPSPARFASGGFNRSSIVSHSSGSEPYGQRLLLWHYGSSFHSWPTRLAVTPQPSDLVRISPSPNACGFSTSA